MNIDNLREEIDAVDNEILRLLHQRAEIVQEIAILKARNGLSMVDKERERTILLRVQKRCSSPLSSDAVKIIFRNVIKESRRIQSVIIERLNRSK